MVSFARESGNGPRLALFTAGESVAGEGGSLSADMTLSQFFQVYFLPVWLAGRRSAEGTLVAYRESIEWWIRLAGDPPLGQIDDFCTARFVVTLSEQAGRKKKDQPLADHTVRKHCRQIQTVLDATGPRGKHNRHGQGVLESAPFLEPVKVREVPAKNRFSVPQLERILLACESMDRPGIDKVRPADLWRALIVMFYYTGARVGSLLKLEY